MADKREALKERIKLASEGYCLSQNYSRSNLPKHLKNQGIQQKKYYFEQILDVLKELHSIKDV